MTVRFLFAGLALLALAGCAQPPSRTTTAPDASMAIALPPMKTFGPARPMAPQRSNGEIARDFLDLSFKLESGAELKRFTRFDGPVTIGLTGRVTPIFEYELDRLIGRLRREARLDVRRASPGTVPRITVEAITRAQLQRVVPTAACFVLPQMITWDEFRRNTRRRDLSWTELSTREFATVFVPADISPQEIRDCLHEEIAQALGPLNDLYRLEDSIFNDDNMHSVLTGFDMIVLRATYDPALRNGMQREQVAAIIPGVLARVNPGGSRYATRPFQPSPRDWVESIEAALSGGRLSGGRRRAAGRALDIAQSQNWNDTRMGLSLLTVGRLAAGRDGNQALDAFLAAGEVYDMRAATAIHSANVGIQIAAFALAAGDMETALRIVDRHVPAVEQAENAALLADFLLVRAAALDALGRTSEAAVARQASLGWGRYGIRTEDALLSRAAEIDALVPVARSGA